MQPANLQLFPPIPEDTRQAPLFVFGENNFYIAVGDLVNNLFTGIKLITPAVGGQPVQTLATFNLITIFQYVELLPDHQVPDSVCRRVDWKYALHLPLDGNRFEDAALCAFRKGVWEDLASQKNMDLLLRRLSKIVWETRKQHLPQETTVVLEKVCLISQVAKVWGAMSEALGALANEYPDWLSGVTLPHWYQRYSQRQKASILASSCPEQEAFAAAIGDDVTYLLNTIGDSQSAELTELPEVIALKNMLSMQYFLEGERVIWRNEGCIDCNLAVHFMDSIKSSGHT